MRLCLARFSPRCFHALLSNGQEICISRARAKWTLTLRVRKTSDRRTDAQGIASRICAKVRY